MSSRKLRVARTIWAGLFPLYWIEALGLLPDRFEIVDVAEYDRTLELLATGEIDGNFQTLADTLPLVGRGQDLKLIMASDLSVGVDGVVCRPDITSVASLAGKRLALSLLTYPHVLIQRILRAHGMGESDVVLVDLAGERVPAALKAGEIDAGHTWGEHLAAACADGAHLLFTSEESPGLLVDCLVVHGAALQAAPEAWRELVIAHDRALDWWRDNEEEGFRIVAERTRMPLEQVRAMMHGVTLFSSDSARPLFERQLPDPPALYASAGIFERFFREKGVLDRGLDLDEIITPVA